MTDYFALLGEVRQPWLDEEALKSKFFAVSAAVHPDRTHTLPEAERQAAHDRYTALNVAYNCLREPKDRLRHLLELQTGHKPPQVQQAPPELADLFFEIGKATHAADDFLKRKAAIASPLLVVNLFDESQRISGRLSELLDDVARRREKLEAELQTLNTHWQQKLDRLEPIQQTLSYLHRWKEQLQERIVQLAL